MYVYVCHIHTKQVVSKLNLLINSKQRATKKLILASWPYKQGKKLKIISNDYCLRPSSIFEMINLDAQLHVID